MLIARNTVVTLKYSVRDSDGDAVDEGNNPLVYLHGGYGGIFDRLEEELQGKAIGDSLEVRLEPEDAFGEYDAELVAIESRQLFPGKHRSRHAVRARRGGRRERGCPVHHH
jgi:FKBP-type peptidyl-prolyl cis-trans isomerase SlyD